MINHVENSKTKVSFSAKQLAFCAVAMALAFVLSNIKVFKFPTGGSITAFSMLVAVLPAPLEPTLHPVLIERVDDILRVGVHFHLTGTQQCLERHHHGK